jgi:tetratricopeptide (TPR) repeat protein
MHCIAVLILFAALLSSCATVPGQPSLDPQQSYSSRDNRSRAMYLYSRARLAGLEGDYPSALNLLRDAIRLDPDSAFLYTSMAEVKLKIGQVQEAMEYIRKSIELDPAYRPPYLIAGAVLSATGKDAEAAEYLRTAIKLDPSKEDAYLQLVISLTHLYGQRPQSADQDQQRFAAGILLPGEDLRTDEALPGCRGLFQQDPRTASRFRPGRHRHGCRL